MSGASDLLAQLTVAPESPRTGYKRDLFPDWLDADHDGCNTRAEVLLVESLVETRLDTDCKITSGRWLSVYDGMTIETPSSLDIDHLVPLAEAWDSGASAWDRPKRGAYANDLDRPQALIAVSAASNRSKGDADPAEWKPPRPAAWCQYGRDWVTVKMTWHLTADAAEVSALRLMLATCSAPVSPAPSPRPEPITTPSGVAPSAPAGSPLSTAHVEALNCPGETVSVVNGSESRVDLTGWTLHDDGAKHTFVFPTGTILNAGDAVTIRSGTAPGPGELGWVQAPVWNNTGDTAYLLDASGVEVSTRSC